jgi:hypothetical protein
VTESSRAVAVRAEISGAATPRMAVANAAKLTLEAFDLL